MVPAHDRPCGDQRPPSGRGGGTDIKSPASSTSRCSHMPPHGSTPPAVPAPPESYFPGWHLPAKLADIRQQVFSRLRQRDAAVTAADQRKSNLPLQAVHQMGQPRLRVANYLDAFEKLPRSTAVINISSFLASMPHLLLEYYILSYFYYKLDFHKPQGRLYNDD